jgi:hypothetical protein
MERDEGTLNFEVARVLIQDVTFLQVLRFGDYASRLYNTTQALMLRVNEDGATFRRVGIVDFRNSEDLAEDNAPLHLLRLHSTEASLYRRFVLH